MLNLTQHNATTEQAKAGVFDLPDEHRAELKALLTFDELPSKVEVAARAAKLALLALSIHTARGQGPEVMIGGAPYLMGPLETALKSLGLVPVYAFSVRETSEVTQEDGSVKKVNVFRHLGFVEA